MKLILSETMGYCGGVSRAISMVEQAIMDAKKQGKPVYSLGKIIHNSLVCASFAEQGLLIIDSPEGHPPGIIVFRAHGVSDRVRRSFVEAGFTIIDATCPVVSRNLRTIATRQKDSHIIIVGHENHPETLAMQGVEGGSAPPILVSGLEDLSLLSKTVPYVVLVQTTFDRLLWVKVQEAFGDLRQKGYTIEVSNEICPSSVNRRDAALRLCDTCDAVLVIGGKESANTRALYTLIADRGKKVWHIESEDEITQEMRAYAILGITAGASTPSQTIESVIATLKEN